MSHFCTVETTSLRSKTLIQMFVNSPHLTTASLPLTIPLLKAHAPSVLLTKCHNDLGLSFVKEVRDTEIGHLFEHLVLDHLAGSEPDTIPSPLTYKGWTEWDWRVHPRGTFSITLSVGRGYTTRIDAAITESLALIEEILSSATTETVPAVSVSL